MSDKRPSTQQKADALRLSLMSAERPLDALLPELSTQAPAMPKETLHPRILELGVSEGDAWVMALWADPGSPQAIHQQVRKLLEATLLANLCRAAEVGEALDRVPSSVRLLVFCTVQSGLPEALRAFGFQLDHGTPFGGDQLKALREEGLQAGWDVPAAPVSTWVAPIVQPATHGPELLVALHTRLRELINDDCWGNNPGAFSRCAANLIKQQVGLDIKATAEGMAEFEALVVQNETIGAIRWIPAMLFQSLCDFVGVIIQQLWGHKVEWALCEPEENGFGPPPVFRITKQDGTVEHLGIGLHLLRWCVMPILPGEDVPTLLAWLESEFDPAVRH